MTSPPLSASSALGSLHVPSLDAVRYARAYASLAEFTRQAWHIVEPGTELLWGPHLDLICECLESITLGEVPCDAFLAAHDLPAEPLTALVINVPPRYCKSTIVSVMWPCWEWAHRPEMRGMYSSYSAELSTQHSLARRRVLESDWYMTGVRTVWCPDGVWGLSPDQNLKTRFENTRRGQMLAVSTGGSATGAGGDRVVMDDPLNPTEALSDARRASANTFYDHTLSTRINDKTTGAFVLIMQRLHQADVTGHVLSQGGWCHICLPCVAESDERHVFPRSGRVWERATDDVLWPERESAEQVAHAKVRLGSWAFAGQYQQRPTPLEGGLIRRAWLRYWTRSRQPDDGDDVVELPDALTDHVQSWDMTYWDTDTADYCVGQVWARCGANVYLLDQDRAKRDLPASKDAIRVLSARWPQASRKMVERTANGAEVLRTMRDEVPGLVGVKVEGSKVARLMAHIAMLEAGNVFLPHPREAGWVTDTIEEWTLFPSGEHDDTVDAMSQALSHYASTSNVLPTTGGTYPSFGPRPNARGDFMRVGNREKR